PALRVVLLRTPFGSIGLKRARRMRCSGEREMRLDRHFGWGGFGMAVAKVAAGVALAVIGLTVQAQSGPVACWTFDEDCRSTVGGAGLDGIPFNGASIDGSRSRFGGGSLRLRRSSQQYVRIP